MTTYFAVEVPEERFVFALAEEAALSERDLDDIEARLDEGSAALALTLARSGRRESRPALLSLADRLEAKAPDEARIVRLALDVLELRPPSRVERADRGYRYQDAAGELFVEDPLAGHWHRQGRWGPPIRPRIDRAPIHAAGDVDALARAALDGEVVVVTFRAPLWGRPVPALRLTRAGFARDPALETLVRWSHVRSLGKIEGRFRQVAAYELQGQPVTALPEAASISLEDLVALMERLLKAARS